MIRPRPRRPAAAPEALLDEVVTVRDLAAGGRGVARFADGRAAFLARAFPGDVVRVKKGRVHASYVEVTEFEMLEASAERVLPACPDEGRCGGCDWMALPLPVQRSHKVSILRQSLERVGRVAPERLSHLPVVVGEGIAYRRRVRLHVEGRELGFYSAASRTLVVVERCHVCAPELWQVVVDLRAILADEGAVDAAWLRDLVEVEVRCLEGDARPALRLRMRPGAAVPEGLLQCLSSFALLADRGGRGQRHALTDDTFALLPAGGFVQVNSEVNRHLLSAVLDVARSSAAKTALDVYCGVGNFSLPLARLGIETLGLELSQEAVRHARLAATEQSLPATFSAGDAMQSLAEVLAHGRTFDLVVLDPPRKGAKGLAPLLAQVCRRALVMISCDPVTLARDVADLEKVGLRLTRTMVLDMFPQTHHIESLSEFLPERPF